jgi:hypothetical protein
MGKRGPMPGSRPTRGPNPVPVARVSPEDAEWLRQHLPDEPSLAARIHAMVVSLKEGKDPAIRALRLGAQLELSEQAHRKSQLNCGMWHNKYEAALDQIRVLNGRIVALGGRITPKGLLSRKISEWTGPETLPILPLPQSAVQEPQQEESL